MNHGLRLRTALENFQMHQSFGRRHAFEDLILRSHQGDLRGFHLGFVHARRSDQDLSIRDPIAHVSVRGGQIILLIELATDRNDLRLDPMILHVQLKSTLSQRQLGGLFRSWRGPHGGFFPDQAFGIHDPALKRALDR